MSHIPPNDPPPDFEPQRNFQENATQPTVLVAPLPLPSTSSVTTSKSQNTTATKPTHPITHMDTGAPATKKKPPPSVPLTPGFATTPKHFMHSTTQTTL